VLEALVRSNPELLEVINEIAYERQTVILVALGDNEEARDYYMAEKIEMMNSADPVTWDE